MTYQAGLLALALMMTVVSASAERSILLPDLPVLPAVEGAAPAVAGSVEAPIILPSTPKSDRQIVSNQVEQVWAMDFKTIEFEMARPLASTDMAGQNFTFSDGVMAIGMPIPVDDEDHRYRLEVTGLMPDGLYRMQYLDTEVVLFKTYATEAATIRAYRGRFGDYF